MAVAPVNALEVRGVHKRYGTHVAVEDVSFVVPRGVVYGVLGPNGAGKTTVLRMVNDIIARDRGDIVLFGDTPPGRRAAPRIGYLPEERGLYPKMRVVDVLAFIGELRGLAPKVATMRARAWLERLGLEAWMGHRVQELSKGMQQKVQFAAAMLHEPELVILDEPWSGLDPINADVLQNIVGELRAAGRTVVFSTHQMEQAEKIVDALCIIARGRTVLAGALADIKRERADTRRVAFVSDSDPVQIAKVLDDRALVTASTHDPHEPDQHIVQLTPTVAPEAIISALIAAGVTLSRFAVVTPTLHQIFVERVGPEAATPERRPGGAA